MAPSCPNQHLVRGRSISVDARLASRPRRRHHARMEWPAPELRIPNPKPLKESRNYIASKRRQAVTPPFPAYNTLSSRYRLTIAPWTVPTYPGTRRLTLSTIRDKVTWGAWVHWEHGRRPLPRWAAEMMLAYLMGRIATLQGLVDELRQWIADPRSEDGRRRRASQPVDRYQGLPES